MIRIDSIWLTTEQMGMRAGTDTALARVVSVVDSDTTHSGTAIRLWAGGVHPIAYGAGTVAAVASSRHRSRGGRCGCFPNDQ